MVRVFITGSADGLGRGAAEALLSAGHEVVLHARNPQRAADLADLAARTAGMVIGDLADEAGTRDVAGQANALGPFHAVIHNAGVYAEPARVVTAEGHPRVLAVNVLAPYLLTAWIDRPGRLVYLSSGMHRSGDPSLDDLAWTRRRWNGTQAYCDSKLLVTTLALAVARRWPGVRSHAVDPGWVPTRMGGPGAPDDLILGHVTQVWLAAGDGDPSDPAGGGPSGGDPSGGGADGASGGYWHHQRRQAPAPPCADPAFQDHLLERLADLTGVELPEANLKAG